MNSSSQMPVLSCDVLIVGTGMSGLFAGWRLLQNHPQLRVILVDKLDRTGGRLETTTVQITGTDGKVYSVKDEEGGMRFVPQDSGGMQNLWKLINTFDLPVVPFVMGDDNNRYYFRGKSFSVAEANANSCALWSSIFNLAPGEQHKSPVEILAEVMQAILDQNKDKGTYQAGQWPNSPETWIEFRNTFTFNDITGCPAVINKWGFWSLLRTYGLTEECITWLDQAIGFMGPFNSFINAGESLQIIFDFPAAVSFCTLQNGYQSLPDALKNEIIKLGGKIILEEKIASIEKVGNALISIGTKNMYKSGDIILAIPKEAIKKIIEASPVLSANISFTHAVSSVQNMELSKVGLYFNQRWWHANQQVNLTNGPNFTDLPVGSVYCFSQYPSDPDLDKNYNGPAALTLYTDFIRGNFWKEIQNIGDKYQTDEFPQNPESTFPASVSLVNEVMKQIKLLFGLDENDATVPMPVLSTYRVWGESQFGYGYHQYKLNVQEAFVYPAIWNPSANVYVCNEAWSPEQGWVEGSLIMTDYVMQHGFDLEPFTGTSDLPSHKPHNKKTPILKPDDIINL